jgi:hypothetical protein
MREAAREVAVELGLDEALAIVLAYFPEDRLPVRVRLLLEERRRARQRSRSSTSLLVVARMAVRATANLQAPGARGWR